MSNRNFRSIVLDKYSDYIERTLLSILNSVLAYGLSIFLGLNSQYLYLIIPIVALTSIVIPFIASPVITVLYIVNLIYDKIIDIDTKSINFDFSIYILIEIILAIIVPLLIELKYKSIQGFISINSLLSYSILPLFSIFLISGISEKKSSLTNALSSLPLLSMIIYSNLLDFDLKMMILESVLIISGAIILGLKKFLSPIGVILPILAFYLYFDNLSTIYIASMGIIGTLINLIPTIDMEYSKKNSTKEKFYSTKENLRKEIENTVLILQRLIENNLSFDELNSILSQSKNTLADIDGYIDKCQNIQCLNELEKKYSENKKEMENSINEIVFNNIVSYNEVIGKLKRYGINGEEIQVSNAKFSLDENGIDYISKIFFSINKNVNIILNDLNESIDDLQKLVGINLNKIFITDYRKLPDLILFIQDKNLITKLQKLVDIEKEIIANLNDPKIAEAKLDISKKLNLINLTNITFYEVKEIVQVSKELDSIVNSEMSNINRNLYNLNLEIGKDLEQQQKLIYMKLTNQKTLYDKFSNFLTSINLINDCIEISENKGEIESLYQLLNDNSKEILSSIYENKCISISDLGIDQKFSKYVSYWLNKKGVKATYIKDKICLS
ncbi:hypothetical protein [Acidianus brierleyi]|uniref:hypothetical protein n=1 Tax=Acidianus brierleyi TaxID=41673 RepID=UPI00144343DC|nr:hypothetical protein [Acidianus brierleyi]QIJ32861.1 hypothetical protein DFR85_15915 [Acidianus brierleyi]